MSKGKRTPQNLIDLVQSFWLTNQNESGAYVHREFERRHGKGLISKRKVQQLIIDKFKKTPDGAPFEDIPTLFWNPWEDKIRDSVTQAFLLQLAAVGTANGRRLSQREAKWGRRLRASLKGLSVHDQLQIVLLYEARELSSIFYGTEPRTEDLDSMCAYQPWFEDNRIPYWAAIDAGLIPMPVLQGVDISGDWAVFTKAGFETAPIDGLVEDFIFPPRIVFARPTESQHSYWAAYVRMFWRGDSPSSPIDFSGELPPSTDEEEE